MAFALSVGSGTRLKEVFVSEAIHCQSRHDSHPGCALCRLIRDLYDGHVEMRYQTVETQCKH